MMGRRSSPSTTTSVHVLHPSDSVLSKSQEHYGKDISNCRLDNYRLIYVSVFFAVSILHFSGSGLVYFVELVAVLLHIVIFTNPSLFQADNYSDIRLFLLNVLLLTCIWSEIHFWKRVDKHTREIKHEAKVADAAETKPLDEKETKEDHKRKKSAKA